MFRSMYFYFHRGKLESEHELAQIKAHLEALEKDKDELIATKFCLQDSISKMKYVDT